jgi:hypothetical protein
MKLSQLLLTTSLCALIAVPAFAQSLTFSDVDTNGDGHLSWSELETAFGIDGSARFLSQNDRDGNNSVSVAELQISQDDDESDDDNGSDESDDNDDSDESDDNDDSDESDDNDDSDESDDNDDSDESDDD